MDTEKTLKEAKELFNAQKYVDGKVRTQTPFGSIVSVKKGAISLFKELAEQGVAEASFYLAMSYLYGYGVDIDVEVAKKHLISAADGGYGGAESLLAGLGVAYAPAKKAEPAGKAAEAQRLFEEAERQPVVKYEDKGKIVAVRPNKRGMELYKQAAALGHAGAKKKLDEWENYDKAADDLLGEILGIKKPDAAKPSAAEPEPKSEPTAQKSKPGIKLPHKIMSYKDGIYDGEVGIDGKPYGKGKLTDDEGVYEGSWKNGEFHGNIIFTDKHGARELREYREGVLRRKKPLGPNEKPEWTAADEVQAKKPEPKSEPTAQKSKPGIKLPHKIMSYKGGIYDGEVGIDGKPYGKGKLTDDEGVYEGSWKNGEFHGNIIFTDKHGARELREYREGVLRRKKPLGPNEKPEWTAADEVQAKKPEPKSEPTAQKSKPDEYVPKKEYIPPEYNFLSHSELKRRAFRGDISAMFEIADRYNTGRKGTEDLYKAVYWLRKAARLGDKDAALMLARYYYDNICYLHNYKAVIHWYNKALPHPDAKRELEEIKGFCKLPETEMDIEMLRLASDLGNVQASLALARYYERRSTLLYLPYNDNMDQKYKERYYQSIIDFKSAFRYYKRAAVKNNEEAMLAVALMYESEHICADDRDKEKAKRSAGNWYKRAYERKAAGQAATDNYARFFNENYDDHDENDINDIIRTAEQGNPDAMVILARKYEQGNDLRRSPSRAIKWAERASKANIPDGMRLRGSFYDQKVYCADGQYDEGDAEEYYENAMYWYKRAYLAGAEGASYNVACMYDLNMYGEEDERNDLYKIWMDMAVYGEEYHAAIFSLAENLEKGHRMQRNMGEAYRLMTFLETSDSDSYYGKKASAWHSKHKPQIEWFWNAAQNDENAWMQYALGVCYFIRCNDEKAKYWWKRAAANGSEEAAQKLEDFF